MIKDNIKKNLKHSKEKSVFPLILGGENLYFAKF